MAANRPRRTQSAGGTSKLLATSLELFEDQSPGAPRNGVSELGARRWAFVECKGEKLATVWAALPAASALPLKVRRIGAARRSRRCGRNAAAYTHPVSRRSCDELEWRILVTLGFLLLIRQPCAGQTQAPADDLRDEFAGVKRVALVTNGDVGGYRIHVYTENEYQEQLGREAALEKLSERINALNEQGPIFSDEYKALRNQRREELTKYSHLEYISARSRYTLRAVKEDRLVLAEERNPKKLHVILFAYISRISRTAPEP